MPRTSRSASRPKLVAIGAPEGAPEPLALGEQIRDLRKAKGMTIARLAEAMGMSIGHISQIERNLSSVSIATLQKVAVALEVNISWFFQGSSDVPDDERNFIVRRPNRRKLSFSGTGVHEELLSPNLSGSHELIMTRFAPGANTGEEDRVRRGEESGLVLSGTLELWIEGKHFVLEPGDSFAFQRTGPHRCHNPGQTETIVLWVICPPSY